MENLTQQSLFGQSHWTVHPLGEETLPLTLVWFPLTHVCILKYCIRNNLQKIECFSHEIYEKLDHKRMRLTKTCIMHGEGSHGTIAVI